MSHRDTAGEADERPVVAWVMSRFPKLTETFVLNEMLAAELMGVNVQIFPLLRARPTSAHAEGAGLLTKLLERIRPSRGGLVVHPDADAFVRRAHYAPFLSPSIVSANWRAFRSHPRRYLKTLALLMEANLGSANLLLGGLAIFPKAVYFAEEMRRLGVQHVHAHFANHPAAAAWIIGRIGDIPYSFTAHGADLQVDQHMLCLKTRDALAVIAISEYNSRFIRDHCGSQLAKKVSVIHCGVDTMAFAPGSAPAPLRHAGRLDILCIGTLYEVKGHAYLIDACRILAQQGQRFVCRLVGDGPLRRQLEARVHSAMLDGVVTFEGQQTRNGVLALLAQSDVLVVPSIPTPSGRREGIPVVLMEAMASGVPVVASAISGIPELVSDGRSGLLVPPREPAEIANALRRLAADPELRRQLAAGGRSVVERAFDLHANTTALLTTIGVRV